VGFSLQWLALKKIAARRLARPGFFYIMSQYHSLRTGSVSGAKRNFLTGCLLSALAPLTALSVLAQTAAPPAAAPSAPPSVSTAPATATESAPGAKPKSKAKAKHHFKHTPVARNTIVLNPPVTEEVKSEVLNVRGQPSYVGEVVGHVKKGETVTVLEEITKPGATKDEPTQWDRIVMPTNVAVWVDAAYIDKDKNVRVKKVNLRGGPGENYSIVGRLEKGTPVVQLRAEKGWLKIEPPSNAYGFVAAKYLETQEPPSALASTPTPAAGNTPPPAPAPTPAPEVVNVPNQTAPIVAQTETPLAATAPAPVAPAPAPSAPAPTSQSEVDQELAALRRATAPDAPPAPNAIPEPSATAAEAPDVPRVVTRDGFVHRSYNIQAPADYELHDIQTGALIDYLQPGPNEKNFKIFVGTRVTVTGPEALDERWPRTPILHIETVDLMP
jgi:uncharacterized protein YgiM (DUF1202 family)